MNLSPQPEPVRVVPVTFSGNASTVTVGGTSYGLPPDTATRRVRGHGSEIVYCLGYDGTLHILGRDGEIIVPEPLRAYIVRKYFPKRANKIPSAPS